MNINFVGDIPPMTIDEARSKGAYGGIYDINSKSWTGHWLDPLQFEKFAELAITGKLAPHLQLRRIR
jgi:hypothetical protein